MDFFTVPTLTGRILFVLAILSHHRRRIVHLNVTAHPTANWAAQPRMIEIASETVDLLKHLYRVFTAATG